MSHAWDAILHCSSHFHHMANYIILLDGSGSSFNIGVTGTNGARQTLLGFATEAEAEAWIIQDKRLSKLHDRFDSSSQRHAVGD